MYKINSYFLIIILNQIVVIVSLCGLQGTFNKIIGGKVTDIDEFPWLARLEYLNENNESAGFGCLGALIDKNVVLTAGHCLVSMPNIKLFSVRLGEYNTSTDVDCVEYFNGFLDCAKPHKDIKIQKYVIHPEYYNGYSDIALLFLQENVKYTEFVRPICLPKSNPKIKYGHWYFIAGWGKTEYGTESSVKLKISLPVTKFQKCYRKYLKEGVTLRKRQHFCAGGIPGKDSCIGDSGAPLMVQGKDAAWQVQGITSLGKGCGDFEWPGIYTKVSYYTAWIKREIKNHKHKRVT